MLNNADIIEICSNWLTPGLTSLGDVDKKIMDILSVVFELSTSGQMDTRTHSQVNKYIFTLGAFVANA